MLELLLETIKIWVQSVLATFHSMYLGYVTPQMFGAVGDGVHDDTEAIRSAINRTGDVYIPEGVYLVSSAIHIRNNTYVHGVRGRSIIQMDEDNFPAPGNCLRGDSNHDFTLENITIRGVENRGGENSPITIFECYESYNIQIIGCTFQNNLSGAIHLVEGCHDWLIDDCVIEAVDVAIGAGGNDASWNVMIRNCRTSGISSYNSYTNFKSEGVSIFHKAIAPHIASNWVIENCVFEHKTADAIIIETDKSSHTVDDQENKILCDNITIRNITINGHTSGIVIYASQNVTIDNVHYTNVEKRADGNYNRALHIKNFTDNININNFVSDCPDFAFTCELREGSKGVHISNSSFITGNSTEAPFIIRGTKHTLENISVASIQKEIQLKMNKLTDSYIDFRLEQKSTYRIKYLVSESATVSNNTIIVDNRYIRSSVEKSKLISATDTNKWIVIGDTEATPAQLSQVHQYYVSNYIHVDYISSNYITADRTTNDTYGLLEDGHEFALIFNVSNALAGRKFAYPTTGNIIPLNNDEFELQPSTVSTIISHFKQNGTKWVETQRLKKYADGRIEDISRPDLVTRSEMEQYIQEVDTDLITKDEVLNYLLEGND